jgi:acyl-CoA dehydrogenase
VHPFTDERHALLAEKVRAFAQTRAATSAVAPARALADAGLFELCAPSVGDVSPLSLVVARELLAGVDAACDAALAVQTLTALPVAWAGTQAQRERWLPGFANGR